MEPGSLGRLEPPRPTPCLRRGSESPERPRERLPAPGRARGQAGLAPPAQAG